MSHTTTNGQKTEDQKTRTQEILRSNSLALHARTDRMFATLMVAQWLFGVACAVLVTPLTWSADTSSVHVHVLAASLLGGALAALPVWLAITAPGQARTRFVVAASQGLFAALLIHILGGRIETHFHVFVSLAFLSFYRDWRTIIIASAVIAADHIVRGTFWPQSIFGATNISSMRWLEHVGWVIFEDIVLLVSIRRSQQDLAHSAKHQAEMEATQARIESEVKDRTAELSAARDQAVALAAAKAEFLANMSHEIRTPLNGVLGFVELLKQSELSTEQLDFVSTIEGCGASLLTILGDILDFSKIEAGQFTLETIPIELEDLLDTVGHMLAASAAAKNVELVCRTQSLQGIAIMGDPTRLQQVLINLCSNAIKFTPKHGQVILDAQILSREGGQATISFSVIDTGIGIPVERQAALFKPFEQADGSTTREYGGTGLGLTICQRIVELMDGSIKIESEVGSGSTFTVTSTFGLLPTGQRSSVTLAPQRLLIVDDNAINRRLLEEILNRAGADTESCADAKSALKLLSDPDVQAFDAALLDFQMPKMDGLQLAREIRTLDHQRDLPLVLLTSVNGIRSTDLEGLGFRALQIKPIRAKALVQMLNHEFGQPEAAHCTRTAEPLPARGEHEAGSLKILLVEDNPVNMRLAKALLARRGHELTCCDNGREAVDAFDRDTFDVVIMDVQMPIMDGFTATSKMRELERSRDRRTPIVALTAHALTGYREECIAAGMNDYLTKPLSTKELDRVLGQVRPIAAKDAA